MRGMIVLVMLLLAACTPAQDASVQDMPCHQMPDGTWMGDCAGRMGQDMQDMMHQASFLPAQAGEDAVQTEIIDVEDGDTITLTAVPVRKTIEGKEFTMYGYNGMVPGPVLRASQGSEFTVIFENEIPHETTVHWHGLRHDNKDDGVPGVTQEPVRRDESYEYTVRVPDNGIYWYHPHVREDLQQDLGLAGTMLVVPRSDSYNPVNREEVLVLDDILVRDDGIVPYGQREANFALMGRYGNVLLVNGDADYSLTVRKGEVVRFFVANVANARPYNLSIPGAKMKLVGSDLGLYEHEEFVDSVVIAPAERYILEAYFPDAGEYELLNRNPHATYVLGRIITEEDEVAEDHTGPFSTARANEGVVADIAAFAEEFDRQPDKTFTLTVEMPMMDMGEVHAEPIEWEDDMGRMNEMHTSEMVTWILRDEQGRKNMDATFESSVGDVIKIRLINTEESMHPMQHPVHLHGQRFVVTHVDGRPVDNKVWKDTVLVPAGSTVDILVDVTNPGEWMLHCHIAEHLTAGMMTSMSVI